jgi:DNA-damage-inducible protein J
MPKSAILNVRLDPLLKNEAETIMAGYGLNLSEAVNIFLHQIRNTGGLPFALQPPAFNAVTLAALKEGEELAKTKAGGFSDFKSFMADLKSDEND